MHTDAQVERQEESDLVDTYLEACPELSMKTFTKMLDDAWPKGMPPEKLEVSIVGPDQVVHTIDKVTLEVFGDQETVVLHWKEEDEEDIVDIKQTP